MLEETVLDNSDELSDTAGGARVSGAPSLGIVSSSHTESRDVNEASELTKTTKKKPTFTIVK